MLVEVNDDFYFRARTHLWFHILLGQEDVAQLLSGVKVGTVVGEARYGEGVILTNF